MLKRHIKSNHKGKKLYHISRGVCSYTSDCAEMNEFLIYLKDGGEHMIFMSFPNSSVPKLVLVEEIVTQDEAILLELD